MDNEAAHFIHKKNIANGFNDNEYFIIKNVKGMKRKTQKVRHFNEHQRLMSYSTNRIYNYSDEHYNSIRNFKMNVNRKEMFLKNVE